VSGRGSLVIADSRARSSSSSMRLSTHIRSCADLGSQLQWRTRSSSGDNSRKQGSWINAVGSQKGNLLSRYMRSGRVLNSIVCAIGV